MRTEWLRRQRHIAAFELRGRDQLALALIPRREDLGRRRAAQDAWVDESCEFDVRQVSRGAVDAFKVPDGLGSVVSKMS